MICCMVLHRTSKGSLRESTEDHASVQYCCQLCTLWEEKGFKTRSLWANALFGTFKHLRVLEYKASVLILSGSQIKEPEKTSCSFSPQDQVPLPVPGSFWVERVWWGECNSWKLFLYCVFVGSRGSVWDLADERRHRSLRAGHRHGSAHTAVGAGEGDPWGLHAPPGHDQPTLHPRAPGGGSEFLELYP